MPGQTGGDKTVASDQPSVATRIAQADPFSSEGVASSAGADAQAEQAGAGELLSSSAPKEATTAATAGTEAPLETGPDSPAAAAMTAGTAPINRPRAPDLAADDSPAPVLAPADAELTARAKSGTGVAAETASSLFERALGQSPSNESFYSTTEEADGMEADQTPSPVAQSARSYASSEAGGSHAAEGFADSAADDAESLSPSPAGSDVGGGSCASADSSTVTAAEAASGSFRAAAGAKTGNAAARVEKNDAETAEESLGETQDRGFVAASQGVMRDSSLAPTPISGAFAVNAAAMEWEQGQQDNSFTAAARELSKGSSPDGAFSGTASIGGQIATRSSGNDTPGDREGLGQFREASASVATPGGGKRRRVEPGESVTGSMAALQGMVSEGVASPLVLAQGAPGGAKPPIASC